MSLNFRQPGALTVMLMTFMATLAVLFARADAPSAEHPSHNVKQQFPSRATLDYIKELEKQHSVHPLSGFLNSNMPLEYLFTLEQLSSKTDDHKADLTIIENEVLIYFYPKSSGYFIESRRGFMSLVPNVYYYSVVTMHPRITRITTRLTTVSQGKSKLESTVNHFAFIDRTANSRRDDKCWRPVEPVRSQCEKTTTNRKKNGTVIDLDLSKNRK